VVTPSGAAGVQIPAGTFTQQVTVTVSRIEVSTAPGSGPLPTSLKQYGPFYELTTNPPVLQFSNDARVGICQVSNPSNPYYPPEPHALLRLAHKVGNDIEVLEPVSVNDFLVCGDVLPIRASSHNSSRFLSRLESIAAHVTGFLRPVRVYAAHGGLGGKVKSFSPFGAVQLAAEQLAFASVSAGVEFTCALTVSGKAYCWGSNDASVLGLGQTSIASSPQPVAVSMQQTFTSIAATWQHVCAATSSGNGFCWGQNNIGQVGDGTTNTPTTPVSVFSARRFASGLSPDHTCALNFETLRASCWGRNQEGQLGIGSVDNNAHTRPEDVAISGPSPTTWSELSIGPRHSCGTSGTFIFCWGSGDDGKLGDGTATNRTVPTLVAGNLNFAAVAAGDLFTCGLTNTGAAYCWGQNVRGELGTGGSVQNQFSPAPVAGGLTFSRITAGSGFACGVTPFGDGYCWGLNTSGQLGDGTTIDRRSPVLVGGGLKFRSITAGGTHACGLTTSPERIYCWGSNSRGQLGDGTTTARTLPVRVTNQQ
jgi:alpha-tubulin suppressor-like RCC1 family protein